ADDGPGRGTAGNPCRDGAGRADAAVGAGAGWNLGGGRAADDGVAAAPAAAFRAWAGHAAAWRRGLLAGAGNGGAACRGRPVAAADRAAGGFRAALHRAGTA